MSHRGSIFSLNGSFLSLHVSSLSLTASDFEADADLYPIFDFDADPASKIDADPDSQEWSAVYQDCPMSVPGISVVIQRPILLV